MSDIINSAAHLAMKPCPGCGVMLLTLAEQREEIRRLRDALREPERLTGTGE